MKKEPLDCGTWKSIAQSCSNVMITNVTERQYHAFMAVFGKKLSPSFFFVAITMAILLSGKYLRDKLEESLRVVPLSSHNLDMSLRTTKLRKALAENEKVMKCLFSISGRMKNLRKDQYLLAVTTETFRCIVFEMQLGRKNWLVTRTP